MTGAVDLVLPVAKIAEALAKFSRRTTVTRTRSGLRPKSSIHDWAASRSLVFHAPRLPTISPYKEGYTGAPDRERRMAVAAITAGDMDRYLELLRERYR